MDRETKTLLVSVGIALAILWLFKPSKNSSSDSADSSDNKYKEPKVVDDKESKLKEDAVVGLQAMRDAINNGESAKELDKLKSVILNEHDIKIMINKKTKKLRAMSKDGKVIAEEE
jgi:hypothetical protein